MFEGTDVLKFMQDHEKWLLDNGERDVYAKQIPHVYQALMRGNKAEALVALQTHVNALKATCPLYAVELQKKLDKVML